MNSPEHLQFSPAPLAETMAEFRRRVYPVSPEQLQRLSAPITNSGDRLRPYSIIGCWENETSLSFAFVTYENQLSPIMRIELRASRLGGTEIQSCLSQSWANRTTQAVLGLYVISLVVYALAQYYGFASVAEYKVQTGMMLTACMSVMGIWFARVDDQSTRRRLDKVCKNVIAELRRKQLVEK